jgi:hypothetical protein
MKAFIEVRNSSSPVIGCDACCYNIYCVDCGCEITEERLKSKPDAVRCVDCQELCKLVEARRTL